MRHLLLVIALLCIPLPVSGQDTGPTSPDAGDAGGAATPTAPVVVDAPPDAPPEPASPAKTREIGPSTSPADVAARLGVPAAELDVPDSVASHRDATRQRIAALDAERKGLETQLEWTRRLAPPPIVPQPNPAHRRRTRRWGCGARAA